MSLQDLLKYRRHIHALAKHSSLAQSQEILTNLYDAVQQHAPAVLAPDVSVASNSIQHAITKNIEDITAVKQRLADLERRIQAEIYNLHDEYQAASKKLYALQLQHRPVASILNDWPALDDHQRTLLRSRVMTHSSWTDTGLIIRPGPDALVESMSSMGTLYLWDHCASLLEPALARFPEHHRDKYRGYHGTDARSLQQLPPQQMRLILAQNFFNFMPMENIDQYLPELVPLLRPGGVLLFTFNDCDHEINVDYCERRWQCYQPGHVIRTMLEQHGLLVDQHHWFDNGVAWIEARRPGKYRALKGAPNLTRIHAKSK